MFALTVVAFFSRTIPIVTSSDDASRRFLTRSSRDATREKLVRIGPTDGQDDIKRDEGADSRAGRAREGQVHAPAVHRHPRDDQERREPGPPVQGGPRP